MSKSQLPPGQRQLRVGEEVRHALSSIFERAEMRDPVLSSVAVTITEVRISPDLRQATVFVMPLGGGGEENVIAALGRAKGFLRRRLGSSVRLRVVPDLTFRIDPSFAEADRIERLLRDPLVARDLGHDHGFPGETPEAPEGEGEGDEQSSGESDTSADSGDHRGG
jgi:ribosome-binding factor A